MFPCFVCRKQFQFLKTLASHFKLCHYNVYINNRFRCPLESCLTNFTSFKNYLQHLRNHANLDNVCETEFAAFVNDNSLYEQQEVPNQTNQILNNLPEAEESVYDALSTNTSIKEELDSLRQDFIMSLVTNKSFNRKDIQTVLQSTNEYTRNVLNVLENSTNKLFSENENLELETAKDSVNSLLNCAKYCIDQPSSEYMILKNLSEEGLYIPPQQYVISQSLQTKKVNGHNVPTPVPVVGQFIPLSKLFTEILSVPGQLKAAKEYLSKSNEFSYVDFLDGNQWKDIKSKFCNKTVIPFFLYFDDFETLNPLGSHSGIQKLGACYTTLRCFPPHTLSKLNNIFLTLLFNSSDRENYGNECIFKPLLQEIISLETDGVLISGERVYFVLAAILGDNLGIHSISGLVESFTANKCCRFCNADSNERQTLTAENPALNRTREQYLEQIDLKDIYLTGIKEPSIWNAIPSYHTIENITCDIAHDIWEGIAAYELAFILDKFINVYSFFDLELLNSRIKYFDFLVDRTNKPPTISSESIKKGRLKMSASEMITFLKCFRFLVGSYVPFNNPEWQVYLALLKLSNFVSSKSIDKDSLAQLSFLISDHHEKFLAIGGKLRPKHHFLIHYPRILALLGNLNQLSTMRYESKHSILKKIASDINCRINFTKSIALRYQLYQSNIIRDCVTEDNDILTLGQLKPFTDFKRFRSLFCNFMPDTIENESLNCINHFKWQGFTYEVGSIILLDLVDDIWPIYGEITYILVEEGNVFFLVKYLDIEIFSEHFHAYIVSESFSYNVIKFSKQFVTKKFLVNSRWHICAEHIND